MDLEETSSKQKLGYYGSLAKWSAAVWTLRSRKVNENMKWNKLEKNNYFICFGWGWSLNLFDP